MYRRKVGNRILEFGHEGVLYRNSFIMYDRQTESLWVHTTGECIKGELKGSRLKFVPSVVTRWGNWKNSHPNSTLLEGKKDENGMGDFRVLREKEKFGVSVGEGDEANLYQYTDLERFRVIHHKLGDREIVVFFNEGQFATAWENQDGREFRWDANKHVFVDRENQRWDTLQGVPFGKVDSKLKMTALPATVWLVGRWKVFYPNSRFYDAQKERENARANQGANKP